MDYNLISYTSYKNKYFFYHKGITSIESFLNQRGYKQFYSISDFDLFHKIGKEPHQLAKSILDSMLKEKEELIKNKSFIYRAIYPNMLLRDHELIIYKKEY